MNLSELRRFIKEILCSIPSDFFPIIFHLQYKYIKRLHVIGFYMFRIVVVDLIFPGELECHSYNVLTFCVGHLDVIYIYIGVMTYCGTI